MSDANRSETSHSDTSSHDGEHIGVFSEIGPLRRVLLHRPGAEIDRMMPSLMERLLFDDILFGDEARQEHARFRGVFEAAGTEVVDSLDLLTEALTQEEARAIALTTVREDPDATARGLERLEELDAPALAMALVEGLRSEDSERGGRHGRFFDLDPVPNYFFQRDPQAVVGQRVVIGSMATDARSREALLARLIVEYGVGVDRDRLWRIDQPPPEAGLGRRPPRWATLEGGDLLVASSEILLVGMSQRTNRRGVEQLAEFLRTTQTSFRHLVVVDLPARRSCMHLDTVFTFIDRGACLAYQPIIEPDHRESAWAYTVDLEARELTFTLRSCLIEALAHLGMELEVVPCGGGDRIDQQREQWTDGANAVAIEPGVILLYRRNHRTVEELDRRGWRIVSDHQVVAGEVAVSGHGRTVVTIEGDELSRARGGPRCMTAPLLRAPL